MSDNSVDIMLGRVSESSRREGVDSPCARAFSSGSLVPFLGQKCSGPAPATAVFTIGCVLKLAGTKQVGATSGGRPVGVALLVNALWRISPSCWRATRPPTEGLVVTRAATQSCARHCWRGRGARRLLQLPICSAAPRDCWTGYRLCRSAWSSVFTGPKRYRSEMTLRP